MFFFIMIIIFACAGKAKGIIAMAILSVLGSFACLIAQIVFSAQLQIKYDHARKYGGCGGLSTLSLVYLIFYYIGLVPMGIFMVLLIIALLCKD